MAEHNCVPSLHILGGMKAVPPNGSAIDVGSIRHTSQTHPAVCRTKCQEFKEQAGNTFFSRSPGHCTCLSPTPCTGPPSALPLSQVSALEAFILGHSGDDIIEPRLSIPTEGSCYVPVDSAWTTPLTSSPYLVSAWRAVHM